MLYIRLKFVKSDESIEDILIQQCPSLRQQGVSPLDMRQLLEGFGERCLIILDGYDEFDGKNERLVDLIKGDVFPQTSLLLTSRLHLVSDAEESFENKIRIDGFTAHGCKTFCMKALAGDSKKAAVLKFFTSNFMVDTKFASPMLLQFVCILVSTNDDLDLSQRDVHRGEIYWRLLRQIYRKYCERKNIPFVDNEFMEILTKLGKLAYDVIRLGRFCSRREELLRDVDEDVFEFGFLVGHQDFSVIGDETSDIHVQFIHATVRSFLLIYYLSQGEFEVKSVVQDGCLGLDIKLTDQDRFSC